MGRVSKYRGDGEEEKNDNHAVLTTCSSISHELCAVHDSMNCVQIEESNEMGTEVDNKGKQPLHPMPNEVVLPPTTEEDLKTPEGGDDEGMEKPPRNKRRNYVHYHQEDGPTHFLQGHPCTEA